MQQQLSALKNLLELDRYIHICLQIFKYVFIYIYTYIYMYICVCVYIYMYIYTHM